MGSKIIKLTPMPKLRVAKIKGFTVTCQPGGSGDERM